jgi:hypothetical protein
MIIMMMEISARKGRRKDVEEKVDTDGGEGQREIEEYEYRMKEKGNEKEERRKNIDKGKKRS